MNFTFPQSYYIYQLITTCHDCPVPVAYRPINIQLTKIYPPSPSTLAPSAESKVIYFNLAITKTVVNFSTDISHAERGTRDIKHIKRDSSSKAWVRPLGGLRGFGGGQSSTLPECGHVAYQIKGNDACINMEAIILPIDTTLTWGGVKVQSIFFSENIHVAYQIKVNVAYSPMQAHFLSLLIPSASWVGSKKFLLHIKLKDMEHRAPCKPIFCPYTHLGSKGQNIFLWKVVMLHIKVKGMEPRAQHKHILCPHTPSVRGVGPKVLNIFFSESSHIAYLIKGN